LTQFTLTQENDLKKQLMRMKGTLRALY